MASLALVPRSPKDHLKTKSIFIAQYLKVNVDSIDVVVLTDDFGLK